MNEELLLRLMNNQAAIQNLDFLRRLIAESRSENPYEDMERLRMIYGTGTGTDTMDPGKESA
jgi:hypothetical protein